MNLSPATKSNQTIPNCCRLLWGYDKKCLQGFRREEPWTHELWASCSVLNMLVQISHLLFNCYLKNKTLEATVCLCVSDQQSRTSEQTHLCSVGPVTQRCRQGAVVSILACWSETEPLWRHTGFPNPFQWHHGLIIWDIHVITCEWTQGAQLWRQILRPPYLKLSFTELGALEDKGVWLRSALTGQQVSQTGLLLHYSVTDLNSDRDPSISSAPEQDPCPYVCPVKCKWKL